MSIVEDGKEVFAGIERGPNHYAGWIVYPPHSDESATWLLDECIGEVLKMDGVKEVWVFRGVAGATEFVAFATSKPADRWRVIKKVTATR